MADGSLLLDQALGVVPRAMGLCDRDSGSVTAGCCDRPYWQYRIQDFANARMQETGYLFALAYATNAPANPFYKNASIEHWVRNIWRFWLAQRNGDGSVCEVYPRERSYCGTAFSAAAFVETVALMGGAEIWCDELSAVRKTMLWLGLHMPLNVGNQMASALLAQRSYASLVSDDEIQALADKSEEKILCTQWDDGTFPEYGGLDAGYQSITLGALIQAEKWKPSANLRRAIGMGTNVLETAIDEDGYASLDASNRNTQFIYPYCLAAQKHVGLEKVIRGLEKNIILRPTWMDDRYCIPIASDYFLAYREMRHADDNV